MTHQRRLRRTHDLERSLTLLRVFLLASALICAGARRRARLDPLSFAEDRSAQCRGVGPRPLRRRRRAPLARPRQPVSSTCRGSKTLSSLEASCSDQDIVTVKVWRARTGVARLDESVSRSSSDRLIRTPIAAASGTASRSTTSSTRRSTRTALSRSSVGTGADGEDAFERNRLGFQQLFEVYAPIDDTSGHAIGAYEIYANPRALGRPHRLAPHDALDRGRRRLSRSLGRARTSRARRVAHVQPPERKLRARTLGSSSPTGCSRRARSRRSRASTRRSTRRTRTRRATRSACSGSRSRSARSSGSSGSGSTCSASPGSSTTSARSASPTRS